MANNKNASSGAQEVNLPVELALKSRGSSGNPHRSGQLYPAAEMHRRGRLFSISSCACTGKGCTVSYCATSL